MLRTRIADLLHQVADLLDPPRTERVECPVCLARDIQARQVDEAFLTDIGATW